MKIGIISINMYSKGLNFACPLHNYAFQQFLLKNGIDSTVVSYKPIYFNDFDLRHPYNYYAKMCNDFASGGKDETDIEEWKRITGLRDSWKELYAERERRYDKFQNFIDSNYIKTEECYDSDLLEVRDPGFDCYICCTDVIWKKEPNVGFDRGFFLASKAMENKWKISYAASRGVFFSENEEDERMFLDYVKDIDAISVREDSLKQYLEDHIENKVTKVLDPVLLHDKEFYDRIIVKPQEEGYIFLYYVMERAEDTIEQAVKFAKAHNLKIVEITDRPLKNGRISEHENVERIYNYDMGIEEWLGYLRYADYVFTNSFHACCFSVLFERQLYVGTRNGDKVTHLLDMFGLSGRRINKESDILTNPLPDIDYELVRPILKEKQKESSDFILSAIRRMEQSQRPVRDYKKQRGSMMCSIYYNSGAFADVEKGSYDESEGIVRKLSTGSWELLLDRPIKNDGEERLLKNRFIRKGYLPDGWKLRFKIDKKWFWYLEDGSFVPMSEYDNTKHLPVRIFDEEEKIPRIPVNRISLIVADAVWKKEETEYTVVYRSGLKSEKISSGYDAVYSKIRISDAGMIEYECNGKAVNNGKNVLIKNKFLHPAFDFAGWNVKVEDDRGWHWLLEDGTLKPQEKYREELDMEKCILKPEEKIPYIPSNTVNKVALEAVWTTRLMYYSVNKAERGTYGKSRGKLRKREDNSWEFFPKTLYVCDDQVRFHRNEFSRQGYVPDGWRLRAKTAEGWSWYLDDGTLVKATEYSQGDFTPIHRFAEGDVMPVFPKKEVSCMVAEALWREKDTKYKVIYCSGLKSGRLSACYNGLSGSTEVSDKGYLQYNPDECIVNNGLFVLERNRFEHPVYDFVGWRVKAEIRGRWYWYLDSECLKYEKEYSEKKDGKICILKDESRIPYLPSSEISVVMLEGVWQSKIKYCSGEDYQDAQKGDYGTGEGKVKKLFDGVWEFTPAMVTMADDFSYFYKNKFSRKGYLPDGWKVKFKIDETWYWYLEDGSCVNVDEYDENNCPAVKSFSPYAEIPQMEDKNISVILADALWKEGAAEMKVIYNSGTKSDRLMYEYDESKGKTHILKTGSVEYNQKDIIFNNGENVLINNGFRYPGYKFLGWHMRVKVNRKWYWYLEDESYKPQTEYDEKKDQKRYLLKDGVLLPYIPSSHVAVVVLEAVWKMELRTAAGKIKTIAINKSKKIRGQK